MDTNYDYDSLNDFECAIRFGLEPVVFTIIRGCCLEILGSALALYDRHWGSKGTQDDDSHGLWRLLLNKP